LEHLVKENNESGEIKEVIKKELKFGIAMPAI